MEPFPDLGRIGRILAAHDPVELSGPEVPRRAAVAAILRPTLAGPEILLIRRAERTDDPWSGHMAFPGGRQEPSDHDLLATATRETLEEIGVDLRRQGRILGRLDDLEAIGRGGRMGMAIRPFVFEAPELPPLTLNHEVAEALWASLPALAGGRADTVRAYEHEGRSYDFPAYDVEGRVVWGLTYRMLQVLFQLLREGSPRAG